MRLKLAIRGLTLSLAIAGGVLGAASVEAQQAVNSIVLSGASFHPRCSGAKYDSNGITLTTLDYATNSDCGQSLYLAPVYFPNGAKLEVLKAQIFQINNGINAYPVKVRLLRTGSDFNKFKRVSEVAFEPIFESGEYFQWAAIDQSEEIVDTNEYAYFVQLELPYREGVTRYFERAVIEYFPPN